MSDLTQYFKSKCSVVYILMRMLPRIFLSLTSLPSRVSRVYGQQVFLDKFPLKRFVAHVHGMLLNRFISGQGCLSFAKTIRAPVKFSSASVHTNKYIFLVQKLARLELFGTRLLGKENSSHEPK